MKHRILFTSLIILLMTSLVFAACGLKSNNNGQPPGGKLLYEPSDLNQASVEGYNRFAMKLYQQIIQTEANENLFISPISIATALSMTLNGANAETLEAMIQTLELNGMTVEEINKSNQILINLLQYADPSIELSIANSLWMREGSEILNTFTQVIEKYYSALVQELDFSTPASADLINTWVNEQTQEKITQIVEHPIAEDTLLFLINAIYFKGDWTHPFDEERTYDAPFYSKDGSTSSVSMMNQNDHFDYLSSDQFEAIRLPYGDEAWNMIVVLPNELVTLEQLQPELLNNMKSWTQGFTIKNGSIHLPRFQMEYELGLNDFLSALGMDIAFDPEGANFQSMGSTPPNIFIKNVKHKSYIDVNEEGTEAAAVTSVEMGVTSIMMPDFDMIVDRPFFFAIEDRLTGAIVFMGNMVKM